MTVDPTTLPAGLTNTGDPDVTKDGASTVTLDAITPTTALEDFGYQGPGVIGDLVWVDENGDGITDTGEPGVPGVVITLTTTINGTPVSYTTTTGPDGTYSVTGLPLGDYTVTVDPASLPAGVIPTFDSDDPADGSLATPNTSTVALTALVPKSSVQDFAYQGPGSIGNVIWNDLDGDGVQDPGEPGLPGVTVTVTTTINGIPVDFVTTTGPTGVYVLPGLPLGDYTATVDVTTLPPGVLPTFDGDDPADGTVETPNVSLVTLTVADPITDTQDFGYQGPGSIGDLVWLDTNGDGIVDPLEPGIDAVDLIVTTTINGVPVTYPVTTGADGTYSLTGLPLGDYTVTVDPTGLPVGYVPTYDGDGVGTPLTSAVTLTDVAPTSDVQDFGQFVGAGVGNFIWNDINGNGLQDQGEPGIEGVTAHLTGINGLGNSVDLTTTTDANGNYLFSDLSPGDYAVTVDPPAGFVPTGTGVGIDPEVDSNGLVSPVVVTAFSSNLSIDTGFYQPTAISGTVYFDQDSSGTPTAPEPGIPGVTVHLTGTTGGGAPIDVTVVTDATGAFSFPNLAPGKYTITETQPGAWADGAENPPPGATSPSNDVIGVIDLTSGKPVTDTHFGELGWPVTGVVTIDGTGTPLPGVSITLHGTDLLGNVVDVTVVTGSCNGTAAVDCTSGGYSFPNVPPGTYMLTETQPPGLDNGTTNPGNAIEIVLSAGPSGGNDFSETASSISGIAYVDANKNGVLDPGELGNPNVTVTLTGTDAAGNPVAKTVTTGPDGKWSFVDLTAGTYSVTETQPTELNDGATTPGSAGGTATPNVISISLSSGTTAVDYLFGDTPTNSAGTIPKTGGVVGRPMAIGFGVFCTGLLLVGLGRRKKRTIAS